MSGIDPHALAVAPKLPTGRVALALLMVPAFHITVALTPLLCLAEEGGMPPAGPSPAQLLRMPPKPYIVWYQCPFPEDLKHCNVDASVGSAQLAIEHNRRGIASLTWSYGPNSPYYEETGVDYFTGQYSGPAEAGYAGTAVDEWNTPQGDPAEALCAEGLRRTRRHHPGFFIAVWVTNPTPVFLDLLREGTIDLALIEGYSYVPDHPDWAISFDGLIGDRVERLRRERLLGRTVVCLGMVAAKPDSFGKHSTARELRRQAEYLRRHYPEMPGIAFYGYNDGDPATRSLVQYADSLAARLYQNPPPPTASFIDTVRKPPTLMVDGRPHLIFGAQCDIWRSTRQDAQTVAFFDGYQAMHASTVSIGIPWSKVEAAPGRYDFRFIDWFIDRARERGLKLVLNLFNTNVCGKVMERWNGVTYPQYTPSFILDSPGRYTRMALSEPGCTYVPGGPPMCPNDPDTLDRERRYVVAVAKHLRDTDAAHTVIMLQLDNEFYYQQWMDTRPSEPERVRCHCAYCDAAYDPEHYASEEEFMFTSLARYAAKLAEAITRVYDIPLYVNSPWWPPEVVGIFLRECPDIDLVGIDGVISPVEPNMLSMSQVEGNLPFAAECPTENPQTRENLDVLPYYALLSARGIGSLLWEAGPPQSVIGDADAMRRFSAALYPLQAAMQPIAELRGTDRCAAWLATGRAEGDHSPRELRIIEGTRERTVPTSDFELQVGGHTLRVRDTVAGVALARNSDEVIVATPGAVVSFVGSAKPHAETGRFDGDRWRSFGSLPVAWDGSGWVVAVRTPAVVRAAFVE